MSKNDCEKFALLATLESQMAILIHAKEEYGRLQESLESKNSKMATKMIAVIDQNCARLMVLLEKVKKTCRRVSSLGGKHCEIYFNFQDQTVCEVRGKNNIECDHLVSGETMLKTNKNLLPNLWAAE